MTDIIAEQSHQSTPAASARRKSCRRKWLNYMQFKYRRVQCCRLPAALLPPQPVAVPRAFVTTAADPILQGAQSTHVRRETTKIGRDQTTMDSKTSALPLTFAGRIPREEPRLYMVALKCCAEYTAVNAARYQFIHC